MRWSIRLEGGATVGLPVVAAEGGVWRCLAVEQLSNVELRADIWRSGVTLPAANLHRWDRFRHGRSTRRRPAERTVRQLPQQQARQNDAQCRDRIRIMPLGACAAIRVGGSPAPARR
jgi:hypothetical protein